MKLVKVLFLDGVWDDTPEPGKLGANLEVISEKAAGNPGTTYDMPVSEALIATIQRLTANAEVDVIVIGNNKGAGFEKALAIHPTMCDRTIVVWNDYDPEGNQSSPYEVLGFRQFGSRCHLTDLIKDVLNLQ